MPSSSTKVCGLLVFKTVTFCRSKHLRVHCLFPKCTSLMSLAATLQVVNNGDILASLQDLGSALGLKVRPYTVTSQAPFTSYVASMAKTGVLVARHGPLLGNTIFLPPGGWGRLMDE